MIFNMDQTNIVQEPCNQYTRKINDTINQIEYNAILFYADVLSLQERSIPVTDSCKYFYVYGVPMHILSICGYKVNLSVYNKYFKQSYKTYIILRDKYGEEGIKTFIDNICAISLCGMLDAERILKCIHQYDDKSSLTYALNKYYRWKSKQSYTHTILDDEDRKRESECTKYIKHYETKETHESDEGSEVLESVSNIEESRKESL